MQLATAATAFMAQHEDNTEAYMMSTVVTYESSTSDVTTLWRYTNVIIIIISLNQKYKRGTMFYL